MSILKGKEEKTHITAFVWFSTSENITPQSSGESEGAGDKARLVEGRC